MFLFFPEVSSCLHLKNCFDTFAIFWQNKWKTQEKSEKCPKRYIYIWIFFSEIVDLVSWNAFLQPCHNFYAKSTFFRSKTENAQTIILASSKAPKSVPLDLYSTVSKNHASMFL